MELTTDRKLPMAGGRIVTMAEGRFELMRKTAEVAGNMLSDVVDAGVPVDVHECAARFARLEEALDKIEGLEAMLSACAFTTTEHEG